VGRSEAVAWRVVVVFEASKGFSVSSSSGSINEQRIGVAEDGLRRWRLGFGRAIARRRSQADFQSLEGGCFYAVGGRALRASKRRGPGADMKGGHERSRRLVLAAIECCWRNSWAMHLWRSLQLTAGVWLVPPCSKPWGGGRRDGHTEEVMPGADRLDLPLPLAILPRLLLLHSLAQTQPERWPR
jgi:hypothetical protein